MNAAFAHLILRRKAVLIIGLFLVIKQTLLYLVVIGYIKLIVMIKERYIFGNLLPMDSVVGVVIPLFLIFGTQVLIFGMRVMKIDTIYCFEPTWCELCERPANYVAEALNGRSIDVCCMQKHSIHLTGNYRRVRSQKTARERRSEIRKARWSRSQALNEV